MTNKSAEGYRRMHQDISGTLTVTAGTGDTTLVTARNSSSTIYIQQIICYISTDAAQSWSFEDNSGVKVAEVTTSPGDETRWEFNFGDIGRPLTRGESFLLNVSAAGLGGHIEWYGYRRYDSGVAVAASSAN